ncbi:MAG TPA: amidohydrolase family protein [Xanthobacteraceae bacterium]|nr:amidohydrolase family protein [Xanthobacteraceae bacterium]
MTDVLDRVQDSKTQSKPGRAAPKPQRPGIVDCDIHPLAKSAAEFKPFMSARWWEHMTTYGSGVRQAFASTLAYPRMAPEVSRADAWPPGGGPPGSDLDFMRAQHLDANGIAHGVLIPLRMNAGNQRNLEFGAALCRAINEWQIENWVVPEPRLHGSIQVSADDIDFSVAEIRRCAQDRRYVQILIPPRNSEPLGRKRYWPIFEAAVEAGLPIGMHVGGVSGFPAGAGTGAVSYYYEEHQSLVQAMQAVIVSMILEGAFEAFPSLRLTCIEGGFGWAPSLGWRMDKHWKAFRSEVPHLKRAPSEYLREHVYLTTQPVEEPEKPEDLARLMEWIGYDRLMFSSDYPHWDFDDPAYAFKHRMTDEQKQKLFAGNATRLFRLGAA